MLFNDISRVNGTIVNGSQFATGRSRTRATESFPPKAKDDGWRAIIVRRAIRYSVACEGVYWWRRTRRNERRWGEEEGEGEEREPDTLLIRDPKEPPAQQVHRRWFSSSFSLTAQASSHGSSWPACTLRTRSPTVVNSSFFSTRRGTEGRKAFSSRCRSGLGLGKKGSIGDGQMRLPV